MTDTAIILCGGQGTRFRAVNPDIPKSLAPIEKKPFIGLLIDKLVLTGISKIVLSTGHMSEKIERYISSRSDANFIFSKENKPLGTGGALLEAINFCDNSEILIINGDSFVDADLSEFLIHHRTLNSQFSILGSSSRAHETKFNMHVQNNHLVASFGQINDNSNNLMSAGIYITSPFFLKNFRPIGNSLENDFFPTWAHCKHLYAKEIKSTVFDIGSPVGYNTFMSYFKNNKKAYGCL